MAITTLPDPTWLDWTDWQKTVVGFNPELTSQLFWLGMDWKEFGRRLTLIEPSTPRPEFFKDWKAWVLALKQALGV